MINKAYSPRIFYQLISERLIEQECIGWKPDLGDIYYTPELKKHIQYEKRVWSNSWTDRMVYVRKLVFKTQTEAVNMSRKLMRVVKGGKSE